MSTIQNITLRRRPTFSHIGTVILKHVLNKTCVVLLAPPPYLKSFGKGVIMVFNATFNDTSAISWRSLLLVEETGIPGENHRPVASH